MKKFLATFFASLLILLLSGNSLFYAFAYLGRICNSSVEMSERLENSRLDTGQENLALIKQYTSSDRDTGILQIAASEVAEAEHELTAPRKKLPLTHYFPALFCALTSGILVNCIEEIFPFIKHFAYISSYRPHLIFRVFRI